MISTKQFTYAIIEDSEDVCLNIADRMQQYKNWKLVGSTGFINQAIQIVSTLQPNLLFLDWQIKGGSTYEILDYIKANKQTYQPYIIYFTGYASEEKEIAFTILNQYKVNKFLVKPIFENLTNNLSDYICEATNLDSDNFQIIIKDIENNIHRINPHHIVYLCVFDSNNRTKSIYLSNGEVIISKITMPEMEQILNAHQIEFNFPNKRESIVTKKYISKIIDDNLIFSIPIPKIAINSTNLSTIKKWLK